ncbi:MAG: ribosome silencing factor [Rhizobiaceae bacterium]
MQTGPGSKGKAARDTKTATDAVKEVLDTVIESLEDSKAEDLLNINIQRKSALGDYMVVASGRSHRHVGAIADHLLRDLKSKGFGTPKTEGLPACDWVLIDTGDIIVHIFRPEVREFYGLEKMWLMPDQQDVH